jgi:methionine biosynthesis protein MetW
MTTETISIDHRIILRMVTPGSTVLDLGCGTGELLSLLTQEKQTRGQGIEIDEQAIYGCVARGLNVFHGDIDSGLSEYPNKSFDYVILNQSLQQVEHLERVLLDSLRVGKKVIVGFPNFAYIGSRLQLFFGGKAPVTPSLPYTWYQTPNRHFLSISDFTDYCRKTGIRIEERHFIGARAEPRFLPNLLARSAIFLISK